MTRASMTLIVCLLAVSSSSAAPPPQPATATAWRVTARLLTRTGGDHLQQRKGFLISDPVAREVSFEGQTPDGFHARYDQLTSLHSEHGVAYPNRLFNRGLELHLTIRYTGDAGARLISIVRLTGADAAETLAHLEADTGLTIDRTEARRSFLGLPIRVAVGDSMSITDITGGTTKGRLAALSESSLTVVSPGGVTRIFDDANVAKVRLRYRPGQAALRGFLSGAAAGGAAVALVCGANDGCVADDVAPALLVVGAVAGWSAGLSVALGAIVHPLSKSPEVYRGGGGAGAGSAVVRVGPLLTRQRQGIALSVTF